LKYKNGKSPEARAPLFQGNSGEQMVEGGDSQLGLFMEKNRHKTVANPVKCERGNRAKKGGAKDTNRGG